MRLSGFNQNKELFQMLNLLQKQQQQKENCNKLQY